MKWHGWTLGLVMLSMTGLAHGQIGLDPNLNPYHVPIEPINGKVRLVGSQTMANLSAVWAGNFRRLNPGIEVEIQVTGAVNAVPAVMNGEADFGLLSRQITQEEVQKFQEKFGYPPIVLTPALEAQAVFVHKDNPIKQLTLAQIDQIYSTTLRRGAPKTAQKWADLGVEGAFGQQAIIPMGRSTTTGSQVFLQQAVMGGGEFRPDLQSYETNIALVQAVAQNPGAVGFAGVVNALPNLRAVPLAWRDGEPSFTPDTPGYPLVRPLQIVINRNPQHELTPAQQEFVKFIFSQQGQHSVMISGYMSVPSRPAQIALDAVGIKTVN